MNIKIIFEKMWLTNYQPHFFSLYLFMYKKMYMKLISKKHFRIYNYIRISCDCSNPFSKDYIMGDSLYYIIAHSILTDVNNKTSTPPNINHNFAK